MQEWKSYLYDAYVSSGQAPKLSPQQAYSSNLYLQHFYNRYLSGLSAEAKIMDLGCGSGRLVNVIKSHGHKNVVGVDVSMEQVVEAHNRGINEVIHGDLMETLEQTPSESLDGVICIDILEHFTRAELVYLTRLIADKLKKDGFCLAHVPNAEGIFGAAIRFGDLTHELAFTPQSARQLFRAAGFTKIECIEDKPFVHGLASGIRRCVYEVMRVPFWLTLVAETGRTSFCASQNMTVLASFKQG